MRVRLSVVRWLIVVGAVLALPAIGYAQEAAVSGTVTDTTGGVLPGVTIVAVHEASGNAFEGVTDERGEYRLALRTGVYRITAELPGFTTVSRSGLELLLGQQAVINLQMSPSALQETVTVTGEAPLIDVTQSRLSGNVDPRQVSELPVNGRNWMDLTMLAPGSRLNAVNEVPVATGQATTTANFQLNIDGQQSTNSMAYSFGQPRFSRDAIAEFEYVSNRFDARQGRSNGVQVNAITKSGTNTPSGSFSGYFRDDKFNAADFIQRRVLPYSNRQLSVTFGGPIRKDRVHVFGHYEYEREPSTTTFSGPFPRFNTVDLQGTRKEDKGGVRLDVQSSTQTRLMLRGNMYGNRNPYDPRYTGGASFHPSGAIDTNRYTEQVFATLTQVIGDRTVNEVRGGYNGFHWDATPYPRWPNAPAGTGVGAPAIRLRGYTIGQSYVNAPQEFRQHTYSIRDDFSSSFAKVGRHDVKLGGEYLYNLSDVYFCNNCNGTIDATGGPIPANIEDLFPVWHDVTTWNLAPLSPITRFYLRTVGDFNIRDPRHVYAAWVQDDWAITRRLTVNLGLRYDLAFGVWAEDVSLPPFLEAGRPVDKDNFGPRLGFVFTLDDRTVLRGGFGKYFAETYDGTAFWARAFSQQAAPLILNDGRPDFAANPYNGPAPTYEQVIRSGAVLNINALANPGGQSPESYQTSIGMQRQLSTSMSASADYVFMGGRKELFIRNINLSYNPDTGANYPFTDISRRPYPNWGSVSIFHPEGWSNYHALQTAFTKRFSQRWQASATYSLAGAWDAISAPPVPFKVAPDLGGEYTLSTTDQRHRAVFNGIWQLGYGFQLSGLYFYGSGARFDTNYGGDLRNTGGTAGRLRPNGTIVPRNNFVGKPLHRVDLRVQRSFSLVGRARLDGIVEVFNLFNHANYGAYVTAESNPNYGRPSFDPNVAYQPRIVQLGFRVAF